VELVVHRDLMEARERPAFEMRGDRGSVVTEVA